MWKNPQLLHDKRPDFSKLAGFGFVRHGEYYIYSADIMNDTFQLNIRISAGGVTRLEVIDKADGEEYTLIHNDKALGAFVGEVRAACETVLERIVDKCFEPDIFKSEYAGLVIEYIRKEYGAEAEYLWTKFPNNAIFRECKTQKWYAALLTVEKRKIGVAGDGEIEIIDLRESPKNIAALVDGENYLPGYHMNKKHWYTIPLDGRVDIGEIYQRIDNSFASLQKNQMPKWHI